MGTCGGAEADPTERAHLTGDHGSFADTAEEADLMRNSPVFTINIKQLPGSPVQIRGHETTSDLLKRVAKKLRLPVTELDAWLGQTKLPLEATMDESMICNNCHLDLRPSDERSWADLIQAHHSVHRAARQNDAVGLKFVSIHAPECVNAADGGNRWTPLHHAANYKRTQATAALVESRANVNKQDSRGATPLHLAVISGSEQVATVLLNAKADVSVTDQDGETAIDYAMKHNLQMVDLLRIQ